MKRAQHPTAATLPVLLTFKETMKHLHISRSTLIRLIEAGKMPVHRVGRSLRFIEDEVKASYSDYKETK